MRFNKKIPSDDYVGEAPGPAPTSVGAGPAGTLPLLPPLQHCGFNDELDEFSRPEIQTRPVDDLLLTMKAMNIDKVVNFPFPTSPDPIQLKTAEKRLQILGALHRPPPSTPLRELQKVQFTSKVTPLGRAIATFPLAPRFGKMREVPCRGGLQR